eukprot:gene1940-1178_t
MKDKRELKRELATCGYTRTHHKKHFKTTTTKQTNKQATTTTTKKTNKPIMAFYDNYYVRRYALVLMCASAALSVIMNRDGFSQEWDQLRQYQQQGGLTMQQQFQKLQENQRAREQ